MAELTVNTCALRGGAQEVWALAGQAEQASDGLVPAAAGLAPIGTAVCEVPLAAAVERLREVTVSLAWGLQLLSAGLEQSAQWYEAAELHAAQQAAATGIPRAAVYGPPPVGPVDQLQALQPVQGPPADPVQGPPVPPAGSAP